MKKLSVFLSLLLVAFTAFLIDRFLLGGGHGHIISGIPMLGAVDLRTAYVNAYRSLWNKATNNGKLTGKMGDANGPTWLPNVGNKILSQSDIISEVVLSANKSTYTFGINANTLAPGQQLFNTERRLALTDTFYAAQIFYGMRMVQTSGGNTDFANHLFTHMPGQFFGAINLNQADTLWNGNLNLNVLGRTVVPEWDLWRHYQVPQTQYPTFSTGVSTQQYPVNDETYGDQSGFYPVEPMWILDGSFDNILTMNLNNSIASVVGSNTIRMVVIMRGILAQNCGKIMEPGIMNPQ